MQSLSMASRLGAQWVIVELQRRHRQSLPGLQRSMVASCALALQVLLPSWQA